MLYIYIYIARQVSSLFCRWWNWGSERHSNMFKVTQLFSDVTIKTKVRLIPKPVICQIVLTYSRWRSKETDLRGQEGEANYLSHSREGGVVNRKWNIIYWGYCRDFSYWKETLKLHCLWFSSHVIFWTPISGPGQAFSAFSFFVILVWFWEPISGFIFGEGP